MSDVFENQKSESKDSAIFREVAILESVLESDVFGESESEPDEQLCLQMKLRPFEMLIPRL